MEQQQIQTDIVINDLNSLSSFQNNKLRHRSINSDFAQYRRSTFLQTFVHITTELRVQYFNEMSDALTYISVISDQNHCTILFFFYLHYQILCCV
jgi:hypothetical protein